MDLTDAFVLHRRPYRENSALVQFFSWRYGKVSAVARITKDSRGLLQPFMPLRLCFKGRGGLKNASQVESDSLAIPLFGDALYSGFYLNELLYYLLSDEEPVPVIYTAYQQALVSLATAQMSLAAVLRPFELTLLTQLGYGIPNGQSIEDDRHYQFVSGEGFIVSEASPQSIYGADLKRLEHLERADPVLLQQAKRLFRQLIDELLGGRVLRSRELLVQHHLSKRQS
ncbi:DNA repair protein RecO [Celerinatantimonas diazotrophica]|uniref:DNA repair protein RecO n=1 Tax=Celerinatantimonas diazotrophica TaxID=412034 RepID=A0A4V2PNH8_9GAMM|nr:DNA repair protein RecO [Celerinatantimonas diazotrophica]TCK47151.1 DNA replication and repair protein RecO [Celerinatantimonas diazotrophica]CAG9295923.1 DNA repair protein RecO [Celerinatantimonas diazotrophica]